MESQQPKCQRTIDSNIPRTCGWSDPEANPDTQWVAVTGNLLGTC
jgi:hypothetical protein